MNIFPIEPGTRWVNTTTGRIVEITRVFFGTVTFRGRTVSEEQFLANFRPEGAPTLEFPCLETCVISGSK